MVKNPLNILLDKPEVEFGLKQYQLISSEFNANIQLNNNVSFVVLFDYFYHLSEERKPFKDYYRKIRFFELFDNYKNDVNRGIEVTFDRIINEISILSGQCEGVFASKIYHTLYNEKPILDSILADHFDIRLRNDYKCKTLQDRLNFFINAYNDFCSKFSNYMASSEAINIITSFDIKFPNSGITDAKKIDFILWADR